MATRRCQALDTRPRGLRPYQDRLEWHAKLTKAQSSLATQIRTGKIGLAHFLYQRRTPGVTMAACRCG